MMSISVPLFMVRGRGEYNLAMAVTLINHVPNDNCVLGVLEVAGGTVRESSAELRSECDAIAARIGQPEYAIDEEKRSAVRRLLKTGKFSPTGRNRPAQELLVRDLQERGEFHYINNVVDVNNIVSLESLLPISIFDTAKLDGGLIVRIAAEGEGYVFNQSGQYMDLKRCIVCCTGADPGRPVGSPVKDSMETKVFEGCTGYLGVIYSTLEAWTREEIEGHTRRMADLLARETGGEVVQVSLV
jgi:DNA/RNA-binding domain of Phe-tRNA-synthetase-like protein